MVNSFSPCVLVPNTLYFSSQINWSRLHSPAQKPPRLTTTRLRPKTPCIRDITQAEYNINAVNNEPKGKIKRRQLYSFSTSEDALDGATESGGSLVTSDSVVTCILGTIMSNTTDNVRCKPFTWNSFEMGDRSCILNTLEPFFLSDLRPNAERDGMGGVGFTFTLNVERDGVPAGAVTEVTWLRLSLRFPLTPVVDDPAVTQNSADALHTT